MGDLAVADVVEAEEEGYGAEAVKQSVEGGEEDEVGSGDIGGGVEVDQPDEEGGGGGGS